MDNSIMDNSITSEARRAKRNERDKKLTAKNTAGLTLVTSFFLSGLR